MSEAVCMMCGMKLSMTDCETGSHYVLCPKLTGLIVQIRTRGRQKKNIWSHFAEKLRSELRERFHKEEFYDAEGLEECILDLEQWVPFLVTQGTLKESARGEF
jgi:hypothetical protein